MMKNTETVDDAEVSVQEEAEAWWRGAGGRHKNAEIRAYLAGRVDGARLRVKVAIRALNAS